ncbi:MAG: Fe(2+)-trafficking protein [Phycisphaerales bacterium]
MTNATLQQRIEQWEKMTRQDPSNAMGWFSLGSAYREADDDERAAMALRKAIELDEGFSRAYQLLAQVLIKQHAEEPALAILTKGYKIAAERGDVMPMKAMGSLLEKIGAPVPQVKTSAPAPTETSTSGGGGEQIRDRRTGELGTRMTKPPFRGPVGQFIADNYSQETWRAWISQGTKVINELRLDFSRADHQKIYDQYMMEWLGFTEDEAPGSST